MNSLNPLCFMGRSLRAAGPLRVRSPLQKTLSILIYIYKMENMRMPELKALARECRLRGYSQLREAELIELLQDNKHQAPRQPHPNRPHPQRCTAPTPQMSTWEPQREPQTKVSGPLVGHPNGRQPKGPLVPRSPELEAPLPKKQLKHRQNKDSKLTKKFKSLDAEISNLKSQMDTLKDKIIKASKSTNAGFKRKR